MSNSALERHNRAVRRDHDWLAILACVAALGLAPGTAGEAVARALSWPRWPTSAALVVAATALGTRPVLRWVRRRTDDPSRSTPRYLRAFVATWVAALVGLDVLAWLVHSLLPAAGPEFTSDVVRLGSDLAPFAGIALIERVRPAWLRHAAAEPDSVARAV